MANLSQRNNVVWNNKFLMPVNTVNSASTLLFQWQRAQAKYIRFRTLNDREGVQVWRKPDPGWLLCNVDAAIFEGSGKCLFGCLIRDDQGRFVAGYGGCLIGVTDPKHAEILAFKETLSWLKKLQVSQVHIELDSLVVVQAFDEKKTDSSYFGSIIDDCFSKDLRSYSVYFVRRSANSAAHVLAREAGLLSKRKEWFDVPFFLIDVLSLDLI